MALYTRAQLLLLLALLAAAGVGLGVRHWRTTHPDIAERLERIDREIAESTEAGADKEDVARPPETRAPRQPARGESEPRAPARSRAPKRHALDEAGPPLDLNRATVADLMRLPGVGPVLARRILETRETVGRFAAVDDLSTVQGVGRAKLERLRPFVGVLE